MAKKPAPGRCVHCLAMSEHLDWDHGYPKSWYPPGDTASKPKAPSCRPCQIRLEQSEVRVLRTLARCLDPSDPRSAGVVQRVRRSFDPTLPTTEKERLARESLRTKLQKQLVYPVSGDGALPGFGPDDVGVAGGAAVPLAVHDVNIVGEKFARVALWFLRDEQFVETTHLITTHVVHAANVLDVEALVRRAKPCVIAEGAAITIATSEDDPRTHLILFELWGRLKLFTSVLPASGR